MCPILQMRKPGHREAGYLAQGHTARKWQAKLSATVSGAHRPAGAMTATVQ